MTESGINTVSLRWCRVFWYIVTDVSEEHAASVLKEEEPFPTQKKEAAPSSETSVINDLPDYTAINYRWL
jgi:hypothetical protein